LPEERTKKDVDIPRRLTIIKYCMDRDLTFGKLLEKSKNVNQ
jgi:hypothetical protein